MRVFARRPIAAARQEREARAALYPAQRREVQGTTKTAPAALDTPRGLTHRGEVDERHRV